MNNKRVWRLLLVYNGISQGEVARRLQIEACQVSRFLSENSGIRLTDDMERRMLLAFPELEAVPEIEVPELRQELVVDERGPEQRTTVKDLILAFVEDQGEASIRDIINYAGLRQYTVVTIHSNVAKLVKGGVLIETPYEADKLYSVCRK